MLIRNDFSKLTRPKLLRLPGGRGAQLRDDMQHFVEELIPAISAVFESDEYRSRIDAMQEEEKHREEAALHELGHAAAELKVAFLHTPTASPSCR